MNARVLLLSGALLVSPAWSQESPAGSPPLTARSFDLTSESVRRILHDTVSTQVSLAPLPEEKPAVRETGVQVRYVPPEKPPARKRPEPRLPAAVREKPTFLSSLIDFVIDEALGIEEPTPEEIQQLDRSPGSLASLRQRAQTPDEYPPSPVKPKL